MYVIIVKECDFVEKKGTANVQQDLYVLYRLHFIDLVSKPLTLNHQVIIKIPKNIDGIDLRIIKNLYRNQGAAIRIKNQIGEYQSNKRGVRQKCVLSPDLFLLYSTIILRII